MLVPTFILRIVPSTSAFGADDADHREDYARILTRAAADVRAGWEPFDEAQPVLDSHGRRVGTFRVELS